MVRNWFSLDRKQRSHRQIDASGGVAVLTYYKCGSQWVRDLLTHRFVEQATGIRNAGQSLDLAIDELSMLDPGKVIGPIYNASPDDWNTLRSKKDRAVVVVRDPRDILVSLVYSQTISHAPDDYVDLVRADMISASSESQLLVAICQSTYALQTMKQWSGFSYGPHDTFFLTSYERLIGNTTAELTSIYEFLGWKIPSSKTSEVISELSFERRSGRKPGKENKFSHFRKGISGDWKNHFTRLSGLALDCSTRGLVCDLGFETDPEWFKALPTASQEGDERARFQDLGRSNELKTEIEKLKETILQLKAS